MNRQPYYGNQMAPMGQPKYMASPMISPTQQLQTIVIMGNKN